MTDTISKAILSGDSLFLNSYLNQGGNFNKMTLTTPDGYGAPAIKLAVLAQLKYNVPNEITRLVIENSSIEDKASALRSYSSEDKYLREMDIVLKNGIPVDLMFKNQSALQLATGNGNQKMVHLLLVHGADPNLEGEYGSALESAKEIHYDRTFQQMMESFLIGEQKSPFDLVEKESIISQINSWISSLISFAKKHANQTFYVLAIDAGRLKANSEEKFLSTLKKYQEEYPNSYNTAEKINNLKFNPGDFSFHSIEEEKDEPFIDYSKELDVSFLIRKKDDNRTAKDLLFEGLLLNQKYFLTELRVTTDFKIKSPNHIY
ncbi:DUF4303 domain-containing protein [Flavobacterium piscis]|uniref:Ankyrin repeat protein n=1 Tax=Flavobacterium piscis TaxID=1114874 RepID=A0ABU1YCV7_9FLAO|nr:DUF4303 domain-containing protein [Flavobacterium piscis]MDR7212075.1 ankyrin repeat protein [Flavobacterium piscis]